MSAAAARMAPDPLPVIVVGSGEHASVLIDLLRCLNRRVLFMTDRDERRYGQTIEGIDVRGGDEIILQHAPPSVRLVNAVGSTALPVGRRQVFERFRAKGYRFESLIHPSAVVARSVILGEGVQVMAGAVLQPHARIGDNALINTRASVDHDCRVGDHVHIAPGVTLSGNVTVGATSHIGTGASVIQAITIGERAVVAAGAAVIRNIADDQRVAGVPARPLALASGSPARGVASGTAAPYTIMLSAAGRRVALLRILKQSAREAGLDPRILCTDITRSSSAFHLGDAACVVPRYRDPACLDHLLDLCRLWEVRLIVPTIDPDLDFYAQHRQAFETIGTQVMVSSEETIRMSRDKKATHDWLVANGFPTVAQADASEVLSGADGWSFPLFAKPRFGSSSVGAGTVHSLEELRIAATSDDLIVQEIATGWECTTDVYIDRTGRCRSTVPRLRLETRGGEVSKGMTIRCGPVQALAARLAETLPGARGVLNIQMFFDPETDRIRVIEINPRFGGGYPLAHQAGAPMARWMIEEATGQTPTFAPARWQDGFVMLRFDDAVFVRSDEAGVILPSEPSDNGRPTDRSHP